MYIRSNRSLEEYVRYVCKGVQVAVEEEGWMVIAIIKPGFHMIATIAEKNKIQRSCGNYSPAIAATTIAEI